MADGRTNEDLMRTSQLFLLLATIPACAPHRVQSDNSDRVVFFDDFAGPTLDRSKWNVEVRGAAFNDEQQAYVDSAPTVFIAHGNDARGASNGALVIRPL